MKGMDLLSKDKINDNMCEKLGKEARRDTLSPSLDGCHATNSIRGDANKLSMEWCLDC